VSLPITLPSAVFGYRRLMSALELIPDLLLVGVGRGLLKKKPWSVSALKGVGWLLLVKAVLAAGWSWWTPRPTGGPEAPLQSMVLAVALGSAAVTTPLWVAAPSWLLWRGRCPSILQLPNPLEADCLRMGEARRCGAGGPGRTGSPTEAGEGGCLDGPRPSGRILEDGNRGERGGAGRRLRTASARAVQ
jgi:hypothetical protein